MSHGDATTRERRARPPLDAAALGRLALRYVERFSTTRARLAGYLSRKIRERGWTGDSVAPEAVAERFAARGYVDDRAFGQARAAAMARRGLGARRVQADLRAAGVSGDDMADLGEAIDAETMTAAITFARRKRIGPFGAAPADRLLREKQLAAMVRAGHAFAIARALVTMVPGDDPEALLAA